MVLNFAVALMVARKWAFGEHVNNGKGGEKHNLQQWQIGNAAG